ncbi:MAG: exo-alpha-sialidase [Alcanivoracaceae bacterium]|nr:exo-alpha-sialidase [Alcanivoracaceae bacterium]
MKLKWLLIFPISTVSAQEPVGFTLEKRDPKAVYITKQALNQPTSVPKIKSMAMPVNFDSVQVNVNNAGLNTLGDAANEPSIAVNPLNPNQIAIGWRQFNTVTNSFRQAGRSYSTDGGQSWNFQQVIEPGVFRSDPVLAANADGHFYYHSLKVESDDQGNFTDFVVDQWKSYDGGATWVEKTFAYGGDKTWIAIDQSEASTRGNIYAAWNVAGNRFFPDTYNSSLNNGVSFTQPIEIPRKPIFGTVEVGADGEVYVFGVSNFDPPQFPGFPFLIKTDNPNANRPTFSQVTQINIGASMRLGSFINPVGLVGQLYVKVDKSKRASRGTVYLLGSMKPLVGGDPLNVMYVRSVDGGITFSTSKALGANTSSSWQWFGTASVAPNGRLDVIWYDTKNDDGTTGNARSSRVYYIYSYDAGVTFSQEQVISPRFENLIGFPVQRKMGDYIDMVSDNRGAHIAYSATYNGEQDVYYLFAQPSAVEENPDFPSLLTNNAWAVAGTPSQGILSSTLINNSNNQLLAFETIFTAQPDGTPMWLVATGEIPLLADSYTIPVFMPTGDLSGVGEPLLAIGTMTKKRLRDEKNDLVDNKIEYTFDMSDGVKQYLQDTLGSQYDEMFFANNPFYNIEKTLIFDSLLPRSQLREDLCNINGQVLTSAGEKSEGRVQFTFLRDGILELFAADFTYKKSVDSMGNVVIDLDENERANPTWEVLQSNSAGVLADNSVQNKIFSPNGGLGFFELGEGTGVTEIGVEQIIVKGAQLITTKPNNTVETMTVLANNAYCGEVK